MEIIGKYAPQMQQNSLTWNKTFLLDEENLKKLTGNCVYNIVGFEKDVQLAKSKEPFLSYYQQLTPDQIGRHLYSVHGSKYPFSVEVEYMVNPMEFRCFPQEGLMKAFNERSPWEYPYSDAHYAMYVPLTDIKLLAGFQTSDHMRTVLKEVPELKRLVRDERLVENFLSTGEPRLYREIVVKVVSAPVGLVSGEVARLLARLRTRPPSSQIHRLELMERIDRMTPGDVGVMLTYCCHLVAASQKEAVVIPKGMVHCFTEGNVLVVHNVPNTSPRGANTFRKALDDFIESIQFKTFTEKDIKAEICQQGKKVNKITTFFSKDLSCLVSRYKISVFDDYYLSPCPSSYLVAVVAGRSVTDKGAKLNRGRCFFFHASEEVKINLFGVLEFYKIEYVNE